jgi:hypothetical protein
MSAISTIDEAAKLLAAAARSPDPRLRLLYTAEAKIILDAAGEQLGELRALLVAGEAELLRLSHLHEGT